MATTRARLRGSKSESCSSATVLCFDARWSHQTVRVDETLSGARVKTESIFWTSRRHHKTTPPLFKKAQIFLLTAVPSKIYRVCLFFRLVTRVSCDIFSARGAERLRSQRKRRRYLAGVRLGRNTSTRASTPASRRLGKDPPRVAFVYPRDALSVVSPRDSTRTPARGKSRAR